jgi:predicted esterase
MTKRRFAAVLAAVTLTAGFAVPSTAAPRDEPPGRVTAATFALDAEVLDGGEQVTSLTIDGSRLRGAHADSLGPQSFAVHATGRYPDGIELGGVGQTVFDADRTVTSASLTPSGDIRLELERGSAGATLGYLAPASRNVLLELTYTVEQTAPLELRNGARVMIDELRQGSLVDPEVDAFASLTSADGMRYRLYAPRGAAGARPLVVWLHGNGEGGLPGYYDGETPLRANRGALGPATAEAQAVFGGAYVVAPQVPDEWYRADEAGYQARLRALIEEVAARHPVDASRIHVMGASAGGLMTTRLVAAYPDDFASVVVSAPAYYLNRTGTYMIDADEVRRLAGTPTWFVHAKDDTTVPYDRTSVWAHDMLPGSLLSLYDDVTWDGVSYPGHFAWIYTARNAPTTPDGEHLWDWMAGQSR